MDDRSNPARIRRTPRGARRWASSLALAALLAVAAGPLAALGQAALSERDREAVAELEQGSPADQVKAAARLGAAHAARTAPVLARHLVEGDTAVRLAAARSLWTLAGGAPDAFAAAKPALEKALDDVNAEVAMNAAGALATMKVPAEALAPARRRVLREGHPQPYVLFLAARGLVGIDPAVTLAPALIVYLEQVTAATKRGGSRDNVQLARSALERLADTGERAPILLLEEQLRRTQSSQVVLMQVLHRYSPRPDGWTQSLLQQAGSLDRDVATTAWDLLGEQHDAASVALWAPRAATLLSIPEKSDMALSAFGRAAGRTEKGMKELAAFANDGATPEDQRLRAIEVLGRSAEARMAGVNPAVAGAARKAWLEACEATLAGGKPGKRLETCLDPLSSAVPDDKERAALLARWLAANGDPAAKVRYLQRLEGLWSAAYDATDTVKAELANPDPSVKQAAEKALDRIRPAWRESGARQAAAPARPAPVTSGPAADGAALYAAVSKGDVERVKKLVTAANVLQPLRYPQMQNAPAPLVVATNYCGIPQVPVDKLAQIVAYFVSLGANPDTKDARGENILDRAKYSCPPEVMKALGG